ncbi:MAG: hypothetical protein WCC44_13555, partial [Azonexus sp.]
MKTLSAIWLIEISTIAPVNPKKWRQNGHEQQGVDTEEQHLENRIEGDQTGRVLGRAFGDLVPDDDHRDAARQTDHD